MIIEFIVGVSIFAHDVVIHRVWLEDKPSMKKILYKIFGLLSPKLVEIPPQHIIRQEEYPVGFVCTEAPFLLESLVAQ
jgi:hypothetical protein